MKPNPASILCLVAFLMMAACAPTGPIAPPSQIVEKVEKAGAGDLSTVSRESLRSWLAKHDQVAREVDEMCKPIRENAAASWGDTIEGRVCAAAREVAFFRSAPVKGDGRKFRAGAH